MFPNWLLISVSLGYISLLFLIAFLGGKYRHKLVEKQHIVIYALSLGVYCTSWGFLGTSAQAAKHSFTYISVYLAPILLFVFAWPFIQRIIKTSLRLRITSIADLLSARFGKSQNLAIIITLVALIGTVPYIALQLKAIVYSYKILQETQYLANWQLGLIVSIILAGFTIIFGIRTIDITERHPGVMIAIAFESLIKLIAFLFVGVYVSFYVYSSPSEIINLTFADRNVLEQFDLSHVIGMVGMLIIVMSAFLCLPRQFQVMFVEIKEAKHSQLARWLLPFYILVFAFFAAPLGLAGALNYGDSMAADAYVLFLPAFNGHLSYSLFAFLGAVSAASSMVIVSTIALSTMLSNEIVFPLMFKLSKHQPKEFNKFQRQLLLIRKALVLFVIVLSYGMLLMSPPDTLSSLGEVAFGAIAQIGPALVAAFFWRRATLIGVISGIGVGFSIWALCNLLPQIGLYQHPLAHSTLPATTVITLIGLVANIVTLWLVSLSTRQNIREQMQAQFFYENAEKTQQKLLKQAKIDVAELTLLVGQFIGQDKAQASFNHFIQQHGHKKQKQFNEAIIFHAENILASVIGSASAKLVTSLVIGRQEIALDQVAKLVQDNSNQQFEFSRTVLQSAIENANEGISVIDGDLNLVAWNARYLEIFNYPSSLLYIGCPIRELIHYNLNQQPVFIENIDAQVEKRLQFIREGSRHSSERRLANDKIIHIEGNPIPGGGFVMIFSDITVYREAEKVLKEKNYDLESRVQARTSELEKANIELANANCQLAKARAKAEQAHIKKSQYLKACSHDLLQPIAAARLFSSSIQLSPRVSTEEKAQIAKIDASLEIANDLLLDLNEIARIESGNITPVISEVSIPELFSTLNAEFSALTDEYKVSFKCHLSQISIASDAKLLGRILQNLLSNAFRYASGGRIVLGCRRKGDFVSIQVIDNGPGIALEQQNAVFEQFTQLNTQQIVGHKGLGLGLNIAKNLALLLNHKLHLRSAAGHGCNFSVDVPIVSKKCKQTAVEISQNINLQNVGVLCVDNEVEVLAGMQQLLSAWKCKVYCATSAQQADHLFNQFEDQIDILLVDYQLTSYQNNKVEMPFVDGITLIQQLREKSKYPLPAILITATTDEQVFIRAEQQNIQFLRKIIKPIALRSLMSALLMEKLAQNYRS
jgi:Na+/proline symporter/signal transduction histidine kinase/CheY-like chemotaxis protein